MSRPLWPFVAKTVSHIAHGTTIGDAGQMEKHSPRRRVGQEVLAISVISVIGLVYLGMNFQIGPPSFTFGQIVAFGLVEKKIYGPIDSVVRAQVRLPGRHDVSVALPNGAPCHVGSTIEIEEERTLFGSKFSTGLHGCSATIEQYNRSKAFRP